MRIGAIENNAHNTLEAFLRSAARNATTLDWASAFITSAGLNSVLYLLTTAAKKGKVRVLTGLYQGFTEPSALRTLLKIQTESSGRLEVRVSNDAHFHWKAYLIGGKRAVHVVVGSSNLTGDGLSATGELNLTLSMPKRSAEAEHIHGLFEKHWRHHSVPLQKTIVEAYGRWHKKTSRPLPHRKPPLGTILGKRQLPEPEPTKISYFRCYISDRCSSATEDALAKTTNWGKRGYDYFNQAKRYRIGDRVILFDSMDDWIKVVQISDTTRTPVRTPDGVYFAAHKPVRGIRKRRWTKSRHDSLKSAGLIKGKADAASEKKLNLKKFQAYLDNLKKTV